MGDNVPPTAAIVQELSRRGVHVDVAGILVDPADPLAAGDQAANAAGPADVEVSWGQKRDTAGVPQPLGPTLARIFLSRSLVDETEKLIRDRRPDVVVVDCMALALIKGANRAGVPAEGCSRASAGCRTGSAHAIPCRY